MDALDAMLKRAAHADEWTRVVHRCAWCRRVVDDHGVYVVMTVLEPHMVVTDGMCPACGRRALAEVAERRARMAQLAA